MRYAYRLVGRPNRIATCRLDVDSPVARPNVQRWQVTGIPAMPGSGKSSTMAAWPNRQRRPSQKGKVPGSNPGAATQVWPVRSIGRFAGFSPRRLRVQIPYGLRCRLTGLSPALCTGCRLLEAESEDCGSAAPTRDEVGFAVQRWLCRTGCKPFPWGFESLVRYDHWG